MASAETVAEVWSVHRDDAAVARVHPTANHSPARGHWLVNVEKIDTWYTWTRDIVGWVAAAVMLMCSLPFILIAGMMIKLTSRGPAFYWQTRLGKNGRPFQILKLRTMKHDCEKESGMQWSTKGDPRITTIGRILRVTHIDELPQLWNVLKGEMNLIGPRPERPEIIRGLEEEIPHYAQRMLIRPGITGLAQVRLPADTDIESVKRKLAYDVYYIRCPGLWLDAKITVCTALKMAGISLRILRRFFRLPHVEPIASTNAKAELKLAPQVQTTGAA